MLYWISMNKQTNPFYNLVTLLHVLQKNIHQIDEYYINESSTEEERILYKNIKMDHENAVKEISRLLPAYLQN